MFSNKLERVIIMIYTNIIGFVNDLEQINTSATDFIVTYEKGYKINYTLFDGCLFSNHQKVGWNSLEGAKKITVPSYETGYKAIQYIIMEAQQ